jgi:hypothetical protein
MKRYAAAVLLILWASAAHGQALKLPAEVKGPPGDFITVPAQTDGKEVRWFALDAGLRLFPTNLLRDTKTAVVTGSAGRYRLLAYTAKGDVPSDPAICLVIIGDVPPGPGPGPGPPDPPKPDPADPLFGPLQSAYAADLEPDKAKYRDALSEILSQVSGLAATAPDKTDLLNRLRDATRRLLDDVDTAGKVTKRRLPAVRDMLSSELLRELGKDPDVFDRAKTQAVFARLAKIVSSLR